MIAFDLPGHGASEDAPDPARSCTIPGYADLTLEILDRLEIREAAILGWSLGGHIGLEVMARWSGLRGLMAVGAPPVAPGPDALAKAFMESPVMAFAGKGQATAREIEAYARACCGDAIDRIPSLLEAAFRADGRARYHMMSAARAGTGADGRHVAEAVPIPLAIVVGADDPFVNPQFLLSLDYACLWRQRIQFIEDCGHAPFLDRPAIFNAIFETFLMEVQR